MATLESQLARKVLGKLSKHRQDLYTCQGEDRWSQYKEAVLDDKYSMKLQYSDNGEIYNISLSAEENRNFDTLNVSSDNDFYNDCLNVAEELFGEIFSKKTLCI